MKYVLALVFCLFMGVTAISFGGGTIYPPLNKIAQPVVCAGGEMTAETTSRQRRRKTIIETSWTCVEPSGKRTPINSLHIALVAGTVYGLGLFAVVAVLMKLASRGSKPEQPR